MKPWESAHNSKWYYYATNPLLWRDLNLTSLRSAVFFERAPSGLASRALLCRSLSINDPAELCTSHLCAVLQYLSRSPLLETLNIISVNYMRSYSTELAQIFAESVTKRLTAVNLSCTAVDSGPIVALMRRHGSSLRSLNLQLTCVGDGALRAITPGTPLRSLSIAGCYSISKAAIRAFLARRVPATLVELDLRWLHCVRAAWLRELYVAQGGDGALRRLDVRGCERLTVGDVASLRRARSVVDVTAGA